MLTGRTSPTSKPAAAISSRVSRLRWQFPRDLAVERREAVLPACEATLAPDVFEEDESPARLEHASDLGERGLRLLDRAEDERDDRGVEGLVLEGHGLGRSRDDLDRNRRLGRALAQAPGHARVGLDRDDAARALVVREVETRARADLEHGSFEAADEVVPPSAELPLLDAPAGEVVEPADHGRASSTRFPSSSIFPWAASSLPTQVR
jgi:hypothetical protein